MLINFIIPPPKFTKSASDQGQIYHMAQCQQGPRAYMVRLFLVFTNIGQEDVAIIPKVPGAPSNVYPAPGITWLVDVTIYCTVFQ